MKNYGLEFHHYGLAVTRTDKAILFLEGLRYQVAEQIHDPLQNVNIFWCTHENMPNVEVISPCDTHGPLDNYLSVWKEMIYHICYQSTDLEMSLSAIREDKLRVLPVSPPKPAILFDGKEVSFYMIKGFGLIEILQI